jgi:hypothetical protein
MLFLKVLDRGRSRRRDGGEEGQQVPAFVDPRRAALGWAVDAEGITGEELLTFLVNGTLFPQLSRRHRSGGRRHPQRSRAPTTS